LIRGASASACGRDSRASRSRSIRRAGAGRNRAIESFSRGVDARRRTAKAVASSLTRSSALPLAPSNAMRSSLSIRKVTRFKDWPLRIVADRDISTAMIGGDKIFSGAGKTISRTSCVTKRWRRLSSFQHLTPRLRLAGFRGLGLKRSTQACRRCVRVCRLGLVWRPHFARGALFLERG